jgi:hypothetical protein
MTFVTRMISVVTLQDFRMTVIPERKMVPATISGRVRRPEAESLMPEA